MPIENIKKRKIARELQEWIYLGIKEGMLRSAQEYKRLYALGKTEEADRILKRSVDMPFRAIARIEEYEKVYTKKFLEECLELYGDCTLDELKNEIKNNLQPYALEKAQDIIKAAVSNLSVANDIIDKTPSVAKEWNFPMPLNYEDICEVEAKKK